MKNTFNRFLCFVVIFGVFAFCGTFTSCENLFGAKEKTIQEKAYITITTNLSTNARTVLPSEPFSASSKGLTWTLTGSLNGGAVQELRKWSDTTGITETGTTTAYNNMISDTPITLNAGTWTFTLTAKSNDKKVLEATITKTITGGENTLSFVMEEAVGEGAASGQIDFTLKWKELGVVGNVAITLSKRNDSSFKNIEVNYEKSTSPEQDYEYVNFFAGTDNSPLEAGSYMLKMELRQQTGFSDSTEATSGAPIYETINTYTCLIHVAPGLCSEDTAELETLAPLYTINYLEEDEKTEITSFEENSVPTTYNKYTTFALPTPKKDGHIFSGWYKRDENNTFEKIENTDNFSISTNTNLYAKWNLIETWEDITRAVNCVSDELPSQPEFIVTNNLTATSKITISNGITLKALDGANGVTITRGLDNSGTAFTGAFFDNQSTLTLEGITLDGGKDSNIVATAPLITSSGSLTLTDCTLQNNKNTSTTSGGAIYISAGTFTMDGGVIGSEVTENDSLKTYSWEYAADANNYSNYAEAGGGGIYVASGDVTIEDGAKISYNYTPNPDKNLDGVNSANLKISHGGGISVVEGNLTINNAEVSYNSGYQGAGIRCYSASSVGTLTLNGATIKGNASRTRRYSNYGGGLMVKNFTVKFEGDTPSVIEENYSGDGGALFLENTSSTLQNITIQNNTYPSEGYNNGSEVLVFANANVSIGSSDVKIISAEGETRGIFMNYDVNKPNTLNLSGGAKLDAPIYLTNGAMVTVSGALTSNESPVATITPEQYTVGTQVVEASEGVTLSDNIVGRFAVTPEKNEESGTETAYAINSSGMLQLVE